MNVTDEMVTRFLTWPLPDSVRADDCATTQGYAGRTGTNLLTAIEAKQMLEHVLAALRAQPPAGFRWVPEDWLFQLANTPVRSYRATEDLARVQLDAIKLLQSAAPSGKREEGET